MAKRMTTLYVCAALSLTTCPTITNILQCLDLQLTSERLAEFPVRDNSTPQNCLLGFLNGSITGDYLTFLTPFSDAVRGEEAGVSDLSQVTSSMTNQFLTLVSSAGFSNHVVRAYSEVISNNTIYATTLVQSQCGLLNKTNEIHTVMQKLGNSWRITFWDVDE